MKPSLLMTSVHNGLDSAGITFQELECDPNLADTSAFCEHYGFLMEQVANTILVASKKTDPIRYALCIVLGTTKLDVNKKVAELLGTKRVSFADALATQELTGMMIGGVTPFGLNHLNIYLDEAVLNVSEVVMGGGNRSSKVVLNPQELLKLGNLTVVEGLAHPKEEIA